MCVITSLLRELEAERIKLHLLLTQSKKVGAEKRRKEILKQSHKIDKILEKIIELEKKGAPHS